MGDANEPKRKVTVLACRRTGQMFDPTRHAECPYCAADAKTVQASGRYQDFCTWRKGKDPINFGFDPESSRHRHA